MAKSRKTPRFKLRGGSSVAIDFFIIIFIIINIIIFIIYKIVNYEKNQLKVQKPTREM